MGVVQVLAPCPVGTKAVFVELLADFTLIMKVDMELGSQLFLTMGK